MPQRPLATSSRGTWAVAAVLAALIIAGLIVGLLSDTAQVEPNLASGVEAEAGSRVVGGPRLPPVESPEDLPGSLASGWDAASADPVVRGVVRNEAGEGVPGATLAILADDDLRLANPLAPLADRVGQACTTSATGDFGFDRDAMLAAAHAEAGAGRAWLLVRHPAYVTWIGVLPPLSVESPSRLEVNLSRGGVLTGRLVDAVTGSPVVTEVIISTGWRDELWPPEKAMLLRSALGRISSARAAPDGGFRLTGLAPGACSLSVRDAAHRRLDWQIELGAGESRDLGTVELDAGSVIAGHCVDMQGNAIAGARIRAQRSDARSVATPGDNSLPIVEGWGYADAVSDERGHFTMSGLDPGDHDIHAVGPGFDWVHLDGVLAGTQGLELRMRRTGAVLALVVDRNSGEVVSGAQVVPRAPETLRAMPWPDASFVVTEEDATGAGPGTYRIDGVGVDGVDVFVRAFGYGQIEFNVGPVGELQVLNVTWSLDRSVGVRGVVLDQDGDPAADAVIQFAPASMAAGGDETLMARSDASGAYGIDGLSHGSWRAWVTGRGYLPTSTTPVSLLGEWLATVDVRLVRLGALRCRAVTEQGSHAPGVQLVLTRTSAAFVGGQAELVSSFETLPPHRTGVTDAGGWCRFDDLVPGEYSVSVAPRAPGGPDRSGFADYGAAATAGLAMVSKGVEAEMDVVLPRWGDLRGQATGLVGNLGARVVVAVEGADPLLIAGRAETDAHGQFAIDGLVRGAYVLAATPHGGCGVWRQQVRLGSGGTTHVTVDMKGAIVQGFVMDVESGRGAAGIWVTLKRKGPPMEATGTLEAALGQGVSRCLARTNDDGRFVMAPVAAGIYDAVCAGGGFAPSGPVEVSIDGLGAVELALQASFGGEIRGTLLVKDGRDVDLTTQVRLVDAVGGQVGIVAPTDGAYRFTSLGPGSYSVIAVDAQSRAVLGRRDAIVEAAEVEVIDLIVDEP